MIKMKCLGIESTAHTFSVGIIDDKGNILDSSEGSAPLAYLHGAGNLIPGLEKALVGKIRGDSFQVRVEPAEGYGEVIPDLIQTIDKSAFEDVDAVEVGMAFKGQAADGSTQRIFVKKVEGNAVTIDGNHPLAGVALNFDVEIISVREATAEEVAHGHVH